MNWRVDPLPESPIKKALIELKKEYDKTIDQKIFALRELFHRLQKNPDQIQEFAGLIHKISGSAGSYGYAGVSTLCKNMVVEIYQKIAAGSTQDSVWLSTLQPFI
jgi:chemotaxis protein histidine kinase CheA